MLVLLSCMAMFTAPILARFEPPLEDPILDDGKYFNLFKCLKALLKITLGCIDEVKDYLLHKRRAPDRACCLAFKSLSDDCLQYFIGIAPALLRHDCEKFSHVPL